jgi:hypothetical protein
LQVQNCNQALKVAAQQSDSPVRIADSIFTSG